jgi:hypothetical protein
MNIVDSIEKNNMKEHTLGTPQQKNVSPHVVDMVL